MRQVCRCWPGAELCSIRAGKQTSMRLEVDCDAIGNGTRERSRGAGIMIIIRVGSALPGSSMTQRVSSSLTAQKR